MDFYVSGSEPGDERKSWRKNRHFCGAGSLTTARSADSCGVLKGRCSGPESEAMVLLICKKLAVSLELQGATGVFLDDCGHLDTNSSSEIVAPNSNIAGYISSD